MVDAIVTTNEGDGTGASVLTVSGPMTICRAEELTQELRAAVGAADRLVFDAAAVTEIDLAGMQLLIAAYKSAAAAGKTFGLRDNAAGTLAAAAEAAGFSRHQAWCEMMALNCSPCERSE